MPNNFFIDNWINTDLGFYFGPLLIINKNKEGPLGTADRVFVNTRLYCICQPYLFKYFKAA